jgi:hypothetical protein
MGLPGAGHNDARAKNDSGDDATLTRREPNHLGADESHQ